MKASLYGNLQSSHSVLEAPWWVGVQPGDSFQVLCFLVVTLSWRRAAADKSKLLPFVAVNAEVNYNPEQTACRQVKGKQLPECISRLMEVEAARRWRQQHSCAWFTAAFHYIKTFLNNKTAVRRGEDIHKSRQMGQRTVFDHVCVQRRDGGAEEEEEKEECKECLLKHHSWTWSFYKHRHKGSDACF